MTAEPELRQQHAQIPASVMSDVDDIATIRTAIQLGAQEYPPKPFDHELLKKKCLRLFQK